MPKRVDYPIGLRRAHIMLAGGREGLSVSGKKPRPASSVRWKEGPPEARTQSSFLRDVRPGQRAWTRGVMSVEEMERALSGCVPPVPVDLALWAADQAGFVTVRGNVIAWKKQIEPGVSGIVFTPSPETPTVQPARTMQIPYDLIGRLLRLHPGAGRVAADPSLSRSPDRFDAQLDAVEAAWRSRQLDAIVQSLTEPGRKNYTYDLTPFLSLNAVGSGHATRLMVQSESGKERRADRLTAMQLIRSGAVTPPAPRKKKAKKKQSR